MNRPTLRIPDHVRQALRSDFVAGLTVAMVAVPQGMSCAAIAGVNPLYGLHTAVIPPIVAAIFASSSHLITGPTNATALATASVLLAFAGQPNYAEYVFALAVMTGLIRLILGMLRLGSIIRYVSSSVLTGFLAGAGLLIVLNQLHISLGLQRPVGANTLDIIRDLAVRYAIFLGTLLSIGLYLRESSNIRASYLTLSAGGSFVERSLDDCIIEKPAIALINLEGMLYFAAADDLEGKLRRVLGAGVEVLIMRVRRLRLMAGTGVTALRRIFDQANQLGTVVLLSGVTDEVHQFLESSGLIAVVGAEHTFEASEALFESTHRALRCAQEIVAEKQ